MLRESGIFGRLNRTKKILHFFSLILVLVAWSSGASAAGYTCPTLKKYTTCATNYYMVRTQTSTTHYGTPVAGNRCIACSNAGTGCTCSGGTAAPSCGVTCPAGKYLPANKSSASDCATCENGYYCPGGTFTKNSSSVQGRNSCPTATSTTAAASSSYPDVFYPYTSTSSSVNKGTVPTYNAFNKQSWGTGWSAITECKASYSFNGTGGGFNADNVRYNSTSKKYDNFSGADIYYSSAKAGYYLYTKYSDTYCNTGTNRMLYRKAVVCPAGYYCPGGSVPQCSTGTHNNEWGRTICPAGKYCTAGVSAGTNCPAGTYRSSTGGTAASSCTSCVGNATTSSTGQTSVSACICKAGYGGNAASTSGSCTACTTGHYKSSNGNTSCSTASVGYYVSTTGATSQSACTSWRANTTTTGTGSTSTSACVCKVGYGWNGSACASCAGGTYKTTTANTACSSCGSGYYCTGGSHRAACSSLTAPAVTGGTYSSVSPYNAASTCRYKAPTAALPTYCATKTSNTISYSGTAWGTNIYSVTAKSGSIISGNNTKNATCTQCSGAVWSAGGTATACSSCPPQTSGWTRATGTGWGSVGSCYQTRAATAVSTYCSAGQLKQTGKSTTEWNASTISVAFQAKAGSIVSGQTCTQCSGAVWSAGGTATSCSSCPAQTSGWARNTGTGWSAVTQCNQTKSVGGNCSAGMLRQNATSTTVWGGSTISTALQAKPGYIVSGQTCTGCSAGTYSAGGTATSCSACTTRAKYSGANASACTNVSSGYYTTGCNTSGNNCTGQSQCTGSTYCTGGVKNNCPAAESNWTLGTGNGWSAVTSCFETRNATSVSSYCSAGQLKKNATSSGTWPTASTTSVAFQAKAGSIVSGQTCTQCSGAVWSAGGTATSCSSCPAQTSGWTRATGTGWGSVGSCYQTRAATAVSTYCSAGQLKQTGKSTTEWNASTISVAFQAKAGSIVSGQTCTQCSGAVWSAGGTATSCSSCPPQTSGWTRATGTGWGSVGSCYQTRAATAVSTYCSAGQLKQTGKSTTEWNASTISVAFQAKAGSIVSGQTCTQCSGAVWSAGGTATSCSSCPAQTSGWARNTGTGWSAVTQCNQTKSVGGNCSAGMLRQNATSTTVWGGSTISTALQAKPGYIVSGQTCTGCSAGTYSAGGTATSCSACTTRAKYSGANASACTNVSSGYYTTGCNTSGNNCTGQSQCTGSTYCTGGVKNNCPAAESNWTLGTGNGWSAVTSCFETRNATSVSSYCSAGQLKKNATSSGTWPTASTTSVAFQAKAGSIVSGQTCTQCSGAVWSAGGTATSCSSCPAQTSGWTRATGTGWGSVGSCYQTRAATAVSTYCSAGQLKQTGKSTTEWNASTISVAFQAKAGSIVSGQTCTQCSGAVWSAGGTATSCSSCPANYGANTATGKTAASQCQTSCAAGYAVQEANKACAIVPSGYQTGTHKVNYGSTTPKAADSTSPAVGTWYSCLTNYSATGSAATNHDARSDCKINCGAGTRIASANATSCTTPSGNWWIGAHTVAAGSASSVSNCNSGYSISGTAATDHDAAADCKISCGGGYYIPTAGGGCKACPAGKYCTGGAKAQTETLAATGNCPAGTYSTGGATSSACTAALSGYTAAVCGANQYSTVGASGCTACATAKGYTNSGTTAAAHAGIASCKASCSGTQYVATAGAGCVTVGGGYYGRQASSTSVAQDALLGRTQCPTGYRDGAAASTESGCIMNVAGGKYVAAAKESAASGTCSPGYAKAAHNVNYGSTSSCAACTGATYAASAGQASCTQCPTATNSTDVTGYAYWNGGVANDHTVREGCYAIFKGKTVPNGTMSAYKCYIDKDTNNYGIVKKDRNCWVEAADLKCNGGYYNVAANGGATQPGGTTLENLWNTACVNVGAGYWSATNALTRTACASGLTTIGYGAGADEAGDCGRVMRFGDSKLYLRSTKKTTPSLNVKIGDKTFYGNMSTATKGKLRIKKDATTYSVHDDSM